MNDECINRRSLFRSPISGLSESEHGSQYNYNKCLGLPCENIYITGKGGLKADSEGLNLITAKTKQFNPNIVIIELGTNDLVVKAVDEVDQVNHTLHCLFYICEQLFVLGVQKIILCENC